MDLQSQMALHRRGSMPKDREIPVKHGLIGISQARIPTWRSPEFGHHRYMNQGLPDPRDVAARKALATKSPAPVERILQQAAASQQTIADQLRESRAKHPLKTHEEASAQMRIFREAMDEASASQLP